MIRNSALILTIILFLIFHITNSQNSVTEEHAYMMAQSVRKFHYFPKEVNDEFSESVFDKFLEITDPLGFVFSEQDVKELSILKHVIDDDILNKERVFLNAISVKYFERLSAIKTWYNDIASSEIDFLENDSIIFSEEIIRSSSSEQKKMQLKFLKFRMLLECMFIQDSLLTENDFSKEKLDESKHKIIDNEICRLESKLSDRNTFNQHLNSVYLKTIAYSFDPHTTYFSKEDMYEFESMLSKEAATFGLSLSLDDNYGITIEKIIPGGPAWDSELLNEGDIILKVKPENDLTKNFECIKLSDAISFLAADQIKKASFFIRKKNGKELSIELEKEILSVDENVINSFILKGREAVGYIRLSSFYSDFEYYSVGGCTNDLAKEIIKLKRKGIKGLILDLRDNGGGSLTEAVKSAGLFIDYGAVGILDSRYDDVSVLKDTERGLLFSKPLIVLINSQSASASEFLAGALQDHKRAVIVGSRSFGKSTSQIILPIDAYNYFNGYTVEDIESAAYLKLTTGVFFRVSGKSHQKEGITPDVELAESGYIFREDDFSAAMENISSEKKAWYKPFKDLPIEMLQERSKTRFQSDDTKNKSVLNLFTSERLAVPLTVKSFTEFANSYYLTAFQEEKISAPYTVASFDYLKGDYTEENSSNEIIDDASEKIENDPYIFEGFYIMNDLINYYNK